MPGIFPVVPATKKRGITYYLYVFDDPLHFTEIKKIIEKAGYELIGSGGDATRLANGTVSVPAATGYDVTGETTFISRHSSTLVPRQISITWSGSDGTITNSISELTNSATGSTALVKRVFPDYFVLMNRKLELLRDNTLRSYNQESALKYIFTFFLIISIYTFSTNVDKINITHIIIYIFFLIYIFFHKAFSNYLLSNFKNSFIELQRASTATQIITYLKIILFMLMTFLMPLVVFSSVSKVPFIPFMSATDNMNASTTFEDGKETIEGAAESLGDMAKETSETAKTVATDTLNSFTETITDATKSMGEAANNATETIKETANNATNLKGGKKK